MAMTPKLLEGLPASGWRRGAGTIGATLQDIGSSLGSGQEHGQLAKLQADQAALAQQAQVRQQAAASAEELFPGNKMLRFLAMSNPGKYLSTVEEFAKPQKLAGGETITAGADGKPYTAPKFVDDNGVYGIQTPQGYTQSGMVNTPQILNPGGGSVVSVDRSTGKATPIFQSPVQVPQGYRSTANGGLEFIPGGPADPRQAGGLAASRRAPPRPSGAAKAGLGQMTTQQLLALANGLK